MALTCDTLSCKDQCPVPSSYISRALAIALRSCPRSDPRASQAPCIPCSNSASGVDIYMSYLGDGVWMPVSARVPWSGMGKPVERSYLGSSPHD